MKHNRPSDGYNYKKARSEPKVAGRIAMLKLAVMAIVGLSLAAWFIYMAINK